MLGLHYFGSSDFRVYQLVTYMFMHDPSSILHLGFNMLALFMFGAAVEHTWGPKRFLTYYILTGFGAAIAHYGIVYFDYYETVNFFNDYLKDADEDKLTILMNSVYAERFSPEFREILQMDPSRALVLSIDYVSQFKNDLLNAPLLIGASGAIFGILIAYGMLFPNSILYLFLALPIKAKYAVVIFGVLELYLGITSSGNIAHFAHLGGLITGFIIILLWHKPGRRGRSDYFD